MAALQLYPYQEEGVEFLLHRPPEMNRRPHRLLADEQGLGKTPQAIVAMIRLNASKALIICPASVKYNWARKLVEWGLCDDREIFIVRSSSDEIPVDNSRLFCIVNYDLAIVPHIHNQLFSSSFKVAVLDECHRLKNMTAQRSKLILGEKLGVAQRCFYKFLLSGTPVPNRPIEFYIILKVLAPMLIRPYERWVDFGKKFCAGWECKGSRRVLGQIDKETGQSWNFKGASAIDELAKRLQPFMLRRTLKEVYTQLPDMVEEAVYLDVDINQHPEVIEQMADPRIARTEEFNAELEMPQATIRRIIGETKVPAAVEFITEKMDTLEKLVVFAYHTNVIAGLKEQLGKFKPLVIAGGVNAEKKDAIVQEFIANPKRRILILQINAGGEGIDGLQKVCRHIVYVELDWSEGGMRQTRSRLHRIGQDGVVVATYLLVDNSLETVMAAVLERKSSVINQLMKRMNPMPLEQELKRIADALERSNELLAGQVGASSTKAASKPAAAEEEDEKPASNKGAAAAKAAAGKGKAKGPTAADVKAAAKALVDEERGTQADCKKIVKKIGGGALADLEESQYQEAIDALNAHGAEASGDDMDDL